MAFNRSRFRSPEYDPGLSQKVDGELRRAIEHDGSFNVRRFGKRFEGLHLYQYLVTCSWRDFLLWTAAFLLGTNLLFASIYFFTGTGHLQGVPECPPWQAFWYDFFFSVQTFSAVGYGAIAPRDLLGGFISSAEALFGLLCFALVTGLLFARFSRPTARILFSSMAIVSPYQDKTALMFRVVNQRSNVMIDLTADAIMSWVETVNGKVMRRFAALPLERPSIFFFPLPWTIVHPIDETSPLWGLDSDALAAKQAEVMILIRGYDDTFSQTVHTRNSYRFDEITFGRKFTPIFHVDDFGTVMVNVDLIDQTEEAVLAVEVNLEEM